MKQILLSTGLSDSFTQAKLVGFEPTTMIMVDVVPSAFAPFGKAVILKRNDDKGMSDGL